MTAAIYTAIQNNPEIIGFVLLVIGMTVAQLVWERSLKGGNSQ